MSSTEPSLNISPAFTASDPILGSLWDSSNQDLDFLGLSSSAFNDDLDDEANQSHSPSHGLDYLLDLQPDPSLPKSLVPDWGALDDSAHQHQKTQAAEAMLCRQSTVEKHDISVIDNSTPQIESDLHPYLRISKSRNIPCPRSQTSTARPMPMPRLGASVDSSSICFTNTRSALSRSSSITSTRSDRGPSRVEVSEVQQQDETLFGQFVFTSNPALATSRASPHSRGPLLDPARLNMKAVKTVGACWRCKINRKTCKPETPCKPCQTSPSNSPWQIIGCKRRALKDEMPPIILCPKSTSQDLDHMEISFERPLTMSQTAEDVSHVQYDTSVGNVHLPVISALSPRWDHNLVTILTNLNVEKPLIDELRVSTDIPMQILVLPTLKPLEKSVLAIVWELFYCPSLQSMLSPWTKLLGKSVGSFIRLLRSAAIYQADLENDGLISQSLTCLQSSLVALHAMNSGNLNAQSHQSCNISTCKIEVFRNLQFNVQHYIDELSSAILKKDNTRSRKWWLAAFYSFCIQSVVRHCLVALTPFSSPPSEKSTPGSRDYLRLAIRLFIAISGNHDPLSQKGPVEDLMQVDADPGIVAEHYSYENVRIAVKYSSWSKMGIRCSGDFLRHIFDEGELMGVEVEDRMFADVTISPEPYLPETFSLESYRKLRSDWDKARKNYTNHVVLVGKQHGWESEPYCTTEGQWEKIESSWNKYSRVTILKILEACGYSRKFEQLDSLFRTRDSKYPSTHGEQPVLYDSLRKAFDTPNSDPVNLTAHNLIFEEGQRFDGDLYWPRWVRGPYESLQEGWCGMCQPGRWLSLDGSYQDDKDFNHGVSSCTGKAYDEPAETRHVGGIWWGLCRSCGEWIGLDRTEEEVSWFVHAFGCYT